VRRQRTIFAAGGTALLVAALLAPPLGAQLAESPKAALVVVASAACAVSLDGRKVADIETDQPFRLEVAHGEYVVSAVAADGRRWSKIVRIGDVKAIVQIEFAREATPPASPVAPQRTAVAAPASAVAYPAASGSSWVLIPAGEFDMGCSSDDTECNPTEFPRRHIAVPTPFEIMDRLVTVAQFRDWASSSQRKLPTQPKWSADDAPVVNVTWDEAVAFCSASGTRLPTEIEWEYAARAGSAAARYGDFEAIAWYAGNSAKRAHPVGQKAPNGFGLYDMLGNVWEWSADVFRSTPGTGEGATALAGDLRSLRGGSWKNKARQIRVSNRGRLAPDDREDDDGFRCVRPLKNGSN
jgi:formylglycine-generating enzyme required for sulfatase activity